LLAAARAALHLRIASAIERRSSDRRIEAAEIVAGRWRTAHGAGKASNARGRAAETSAGTHCLKEAERQFALALEVAATFPLGPMTRGSTSLAALARLAAAPDEKREGDASGPAWSVAGLAWLDNSPDARSPVDHGLLLERASVGGPNVDDPDKHAPRRLCLA